MTIELAGPQEEFVLSEAARQGVTPEIFIRSLVSDYERYEREFRQAVQAGLEDVAAGRVVEHEVFFDQWEREIAARHAAEEPK